MIIATNTERDWLNQIGFDGFKMNQERILLVLAFVLFSLSVFA